MLLCVRTCYILLEYNNSPNTKTAPKSHTPKHTHTYNRHRGTGNHLPRQRAVRAMGRGP